MSKFSDASDVTKLNQKMSMEVSSSNKPIANNENEAITKNFFKERFQERTDALPNSTNSLKKS